MRSRMCVRDVLLSCVLVMGCAGQVHADDQPVAASAPASPPAASTPPSATEAEAATATTAAISPTPATEDDKVRQSVEFERMAKQYRKMEKDGQTLYCRPEKTLGTRLAKTVCLTEPQLQERVRKAEDVRTEMRGYKPGPCIPPMTCQ